MLVALAQQAHDAVLDLLDHLGALGLEPQLDLVAGVAAEQGEGRVEGDEDEVVEVLPRLWPLSSITPMTVTGKLPT